MKIQTEYHREFFIFLPFIIWAIICLTILAFK